MRAGRRKGEQNVQKALHFALSCWAVNSHLLREGAIPNKGILDQPIEQVTINEPNILLALNTIAIEYRIQIGLEVKVTDNIANPPINVSIDKGTLRELLSAVVTRIAGPSLAAS